jgi:hypothetical protein
MYDMITHAVFGVLCTYYSVNFVANRGQMSNIEFFAALFLFMTVFIAINGKNIFLYLKHGDKDENCPGLVCSCVTRIRDLLRHVRREQAKSE